MAERLLGLLEVMSRTRKCRTAIYVGQKNGTFPISVKTGSRSCAWVESEVDEWIQRTIVASRAGRQSDRSMAA
jgi:prophage regulatory protein